MTPSHLNGLALSVGQSTTVHSLMKNSKEEDEVEDGLFQNPPRVEKNF